MPLHIGSTAVKAVYLGTTAIKKIYLGTTLIWSAFLPSGMTKTGTQTWGGTSWVPVTGWSPDTSDYPGSTVTSDKSDVQGSKTGAAITIRVPYSGAIQNNRQHTIRAVNQSGTVIGAPSSVVTSYAGTCQLNLTDIDLAGVTAVGVEMLCSHSFGGGRITSGATCYVRIT